MLASIFRTGGVLAGSVSDWESLVDFDCRPDLCENPRFTSNQLRVEHKADLDPIIPDWFAGHVTADALRLLGERGVAVSSVLTMDAIFEDRHYAARRNLVTVDDKELGEIVMPAVIPKLSSTLGRVRHSGHAIDEDRQCIMSDWHSADSTPPTSPGT